jgi:hypothetical protein
MLLHADSAIVVIGGATEGGSVTDDRIVNKNVLGLFNSPAPMPSSANAAWIIIDAERL